MEEGTSLGRECQAACPWRVRGKWVKTRQPSEADSAWREWRLSPRPPSLCLRASVRARGVKAVCLPFSLSFPSLFLTIKKTLCFLKNKIDEEFYDF